MNRFRDWLEQARANLVHAEHSREDGDHAWACFAAHQAAEAAVKALHLRHGQVAWGHSVTQLLESLPGAVRPSQDFIAEVGVLDRYYIPTRYPDAHPAGSAARHYTERDSRQAIELARQVVEYCERQGLAD